MRKFLLATAATMGAMLATAGGAKAQPLPTKIPAPGTIVVHLNGYLQFGMNLYGSTYNTLAGSKLNSIAANGDVRLYPGFDATTVNGLGYGAQVELRTATSDANKAAGSNSTSTGTGFSGLYVRRAYGYIGEQDVGYARFGQTDGAFTLLQTGVVESFGDGAQWTGDGTPLLVLPTKAAPGQFIYADQGALYATDKIVLLSPALTENFLGGAFSAAISYEPNSNAIKEGYANDATASATSAALSSTGTFNSTLAKERKNTFDLAGTYALKMNGFNSKIGIGFLDGAPIHYTGGAVSATSTVTPVSGGATHTVVTYASNYPFYLDNLQVFEAGAQTTYAGLTLAGNIKFGQTLDGYAPKPKGARDALAYILSLSYVIGPYVIGGSFFDSQTAGTYAPFKVSSTTGAVSRSTEARTLSEYGVAVGGNYVIGKDLSLYAQYLYGHAHQPGNSNLTLTNPKGNTQVQLIGLGATLKW